MTTTTSSALAEILAMAQAAAAAGDTTRARHDFRNLTQIDPTMAEAWLGYAACTAVLNERRALFARALELNPASREARAGIAEADALLASGRLLFDFGRAAQSAPVSAPLRAAHAHGGRAALLAVASMGLIGLATMGLLTVGGIFVLTSFWGFLLAFVAGPLVSELIVRLTARPRKAARGRKAQLATGVGMFLGGLAAIALGGLLLPLLGLPLPVEAVQMARNSGVSEDAASVLLNNPGLLVFLSSAVAATIYRLR
jgi:hypothetical protein